MRARRTVQEHWVRGRHDNIERAHVRLAIFKRDMARVHAALHRLAGSIRSGLRDGVVPVGELELQHVADSRVDGVGNEGILLAADDHGDDLVLAAQRTGVYSRDGPGGQSDGNGAVEEQGGGDEGLHRTDSAWYILSSTKIVYRYVCK